MINVEVQKSGNENTLSLIRKFSRRVQGTGLVKTLRSKRYHSRDASKAVKKKGALKLIARRAEFRQLVKEGKVAEPVQRRHASREQTQAPTPRASGSGLGENTPIAR